MSIFLRLKHWQVFLVWMVGVIVFQLLKSTSLEFLGFTLYACLLIGWVFSIGKTLNNKLSQPIENYNENKWLAVYGVSVTAWYIAVQNDLSSLVMLVLLLPSIISFIKIVNFSARTFKQTETGRPVEFKSYITEFLLIMYMVIGLWVLQPRLNRMVE